MSRLRAEEGATLVELLTGMVLMLVVLFATLLTADHFISRSATDSRWIDAQDAARLQVDVLTREIRNASPVAGRPPVIRPAASTSGNDLVVGEAGGPAYVRWCVATATRTLWRERYPADATPPAGCPGTGAARAAAIAGKVVNDAQTPLFTVEAGGGTVGIDLRVAGGASSRDRRIASRSSAHVRSFDGRAPDVRAEDVQVFCSTKNGRKTALLQLGVGLLGGQPLEARYTLLGLPLGSGSITVNADVPLQIGVAVTNALGLQTLLNRTVSC